jgi:hypothetical protein
MATEVVCPGPVLVPARRVALALLLPAEVVALTLRYDAQRLAGVRAWWAALVVQAHFLPQVAVAVAAATVFFGGGRLRREFAHVTRWWPP